MNKILNQFLAFTLSAWSGLLGIANAQNLQNAQDLRIETGILPSQITPHLYLESAQANRLNNQILLALYEPLVKVGANGKILPSVAKSWKVEGKVITLKLDDKKWSDNTDIVAQDYVNTWLDLLSKIDGDSYGYELANLRIKNAQKFIEGNIKNKVGIKALDKKTLEITLDAPVGWVLPALASPHLVAKKDGKYNGAFALASLNDKSIKLKRINSEGVQIIEFHKVIKASERLANFNEGKTQLLRLTPSQSAEINNVAIIPSNRLVGLTFETKSKKFSFEVRKALALLINPYDFVGVIKGAGVPVNQVVNPWVGNASLVKEVSWARMPADERQKQALSLLTKAGYSARNPLVIRWSKVYLNNEGAIEQNLLKALITQLNTVSKGLVKIKIVDFDPATHVGPTPDFSLYLAQWGSVVNDGQAYLSHWANSSQFNLKDFNKRYNQLTAVKYEENAEVNLTRAQEIAALAKYLAEDTVTVIPLFQFVSSYAVSAKLQGVKYSYNGLLLQDIK